MTQDHSTVRVVFKAGDVACEVWRGGFVPEAPGFPATHVYDGVRFVPMAERVTEEKG